MIAVGVGIGPYLFIAIAGFLATDIWRLLGVLFSVRLDESSESLRWVRAVSTALIAGLVSLLILFPVGDLVMASLTLRLLAVAAGLGAYFLLRRSLFLGIVAGEATLLAGLWLAS
jgi:hypothetical protein